MEIIFAAAAASGALIGAVVGVSLARRPASTRFRSVLKGAAVGVATLLLFVFVAVLVLVFQVDWSGEGLPDS